MQVLPAALTKSLLAMPVVNTAMLPTFVPASIVKGRETVALGDPTAWEPMFTLCWTPLKVTCACAAIGNSRQARAIRNKLSCFDRNRGEQKERAKGTVIMASKVRRIVHPQLPTSSCDPIESRARPAHNCPSGETRAALPEQPQPRAGHASAYS